VGGDIAAIYAALRRDETHFDGCPDRKNRKQRGNLNLETFQPG
jgi:hypothetical protein